VNEYHLLMIWRSHRNDVASAIVALCPVSFGVHLWLFFTYFSSRPTQPNAQLGFVRALNNHGSYVYISDAESTGLALLMMAFVAGLVGTLAVVPKDPIHPATPRWTTYLVGKTDLADPTPRLKIIFLFGLVVYFAVICFAGPSIVRLIVSKGIVL
jgi:hypothetical protein